MENDSEKFILEADSLGMLDYSKVPPYPKEEYDKFIRRFKERRAPRFITKTGKEHLAKLLEKAEKHYKI